VIARCQAAGAGHRMLPCVSPQAPSPICPEHLPCAARERCEEACLPGRGFGRPRTAAALVGLQAEPCPDAFAVPGQQEGDCDGKCCVSDQDVSGVGSTAWPKAFVQCLIPAVEAGSQSCTATTHAAMGRCPARAMHSGSKGSRGGRCAWQGSLASWQVHMSNVLGPDAQSSGVQCIRLRNHFSPTRSMHSAPSVPLCPSCVLSCSQLAA
jgi:hypothetical protein